MRRRRATSAGPAETRPNPFWSERAQDTFSLQRARPRDLPQLETAEGGERPDLGTAEARPRDLPRIADAEVVARPSAGAVMGASETTRGAVGLEDGRDARAVTGLPSTGAEEDHTSLGQASEPRAAAREGQPSLEDVTLLLQRAAEIPISDEWASEGGNTSSAAHGESSADGTPRDTARTPEELRWLIRGLYEGMQRTSNDVQTLSAQMVSLQGQVADQVIDMKGHLADQVIDMKGHLRGELGGLTDRLETLERKPSSAGSMHSALDLAGVDHPSDPGVSPGTNAGSLNPASFGVLSTQGSAAAREGWPSEQLGTVSSSPDVFALGVRTASVACEMYQREVPQPPKQIPETKGQSSQEGETGMHGMSGAVPEKELCMECGAPRVNLSFWIHKGTV